MGFFNYFYQVMHSSISLETISIFVFKFPVPLSLIRSLNSDTHTPYHFSQNSPELQDRPHAKFVPKNTPQSNSSTRNKTHRDTLTSITSNTATSFAVDLSSVEQTNYPIISPMSPFRGTPSSIPRNSKADGDLGRPAEKGKYPGGGQFVRAPAAARRPAIHHTISPRPSPERESW